MPDYSSQKYKKSKTINLCNDCMVGDTGSCEDAQVSYDSQGYVYECSCYLAVNKKILNILKKLGLTTQVFFTGYDKHDRDWMLDTKKHPPTAQQLTIAFGKYINGYRPGDELWSEEDQDAYLYSVGELS